MEAPVQHYSEPGITTLAYIELRPGSSKVDIGMRNLSARPITIPAKMTTVSVSMANIAPPMLAPNFKTNEENQEKGTDASKQFGRLGSRLIEAKDLIAEFGHLFAFDDPSLETAL